MSISTKNSNLDLNDSFHIYRFITRIIRVHSFRSKVFIIAFIATHVPLLAVICYILYKPNALTPAAVFILVLIATLAGAIFVLWSLHHLLKPIRLTSLALKNYLDEGQLTTIPDDLPGEMGGLLRNLKYSLGVIEQRRLALEGIAMNDTLTGLGNRLYAKQQLAQISNLLQKRTPNLCIALLDIDYFKKINDQYGHATGDLVLKAASKIMKETLQRDSDWIARWGGEEFLILLNCTLNDAEIILDRMRQSLADAKLNINLHNISFTVSLGLTELKQNESINDGIARADNALYLAKEKGRNQLAIQK